MDSLKKALQKPGIEYQNEVRWWLAEGLHTDETLKNDLQLLYDAGFGGAEFLAMDEYGADSRRYGWGSEEFVNDTHVIIEETTKKGMAASMTSGTNWSNANLITILPDDKAAAKELNYSNKTVKAGQWYKGDLEKGRITMPNVHEQILIAVVAARHVRTEDKKLFIDRESIVLTEKVSAGHLEWQAPADADYELFAFWMHGTGQTASPSCSVSYTINYVDTYGTEALIDYWNETVLTPALRKNILKNGRVQLYMDSLELSTFTHGGQFWGYHFMDEFSKRRGYDLAPYLPLIVKTRQMMASHADKYHYGCDDVDFLFKLRNDLYQTLTDLYMENVLKPIQSWLHSVGMTLRAEISYGLPYEISQPGKYVDGIETESLEFASQIDSYRGLAGAAHIYNRLYSSETGATLRNYKMNLDFYTQIIFTQFAAGVARTVLHGYSSICGSEKATQWPGHEGMWPIFSERFGCRQPASLHYNDWNDMIARYQYILRQGKPRMDIGILRIDYAFNNMVMIGGDETDLYDNMLMRANKGLYWQDPGLQNAGYTYDYFNPQILADVEFAAGEVAPDGPGYKAIIVYQDALPVSSAKLLLDWAKKGLNILLVNGVTETLCIGVDKTYDKAASKTPFNDGKDSALAAIIEELKSLASVREIDGCEAALAALAELKVYPRVMFSEANRNVLPLMREDGDTRYVYLYNVMYTETEAVSFKASIIGEGTPYSINCWTGDVDQIASFTFADGRTIVDVTLKPGQACMLAIDLSSKPEIYAVANDACRILRRDNGSLAIVACRDGEYSVQLNDGTTVKKQVSVPGDIDLNKWQLQVEDWNEGDKKEILEDRGMGYVSQEVYYETKKTLIDAGEVDLKPWKDISAIGEDVSGVGYYSTVFTISDDWSENNGALLKMGSVNGSTAAVYVNGKKAPAVDFADPVVDISELLVKGENEIKVEVSSTLTNRLRQRGYFANIPNRFMELMSESTSFAEMSHSADSDDAAAEGEEKPDMMSLLIGSVTKCDVKDYGLTGGATIVTYTVEEI